MGKQAESAAFQRINRLVDANSFVEIGGAVKARSTDFNMGEKAEASDGVITGYGIIDGNPVYIYSQDASVLGGSLGEMHARKILRLYEFALKTGTPIIGLLDCAGLRLQEGSDALFAMSEIFRAQTMASGVIPQLTGIFGSCGGGLSIVPGLTDFTFMEIAQGKLFMNSPNALEGNEISKLDTSSADYQSGRTGMIDFLGSQEELLDKMRQMVAILPQNFEDDMSYDECRDDLNRVLDGISEGREDGAYLLSNISDQHFFMEIKEMYGRDMAAGFIKLNGMTVGALANCKLRYDQEGNAVSVGKGMITPEGAQKAAAFVKFCDAFSIPLLTLTNTSGFAASTQSEMEISKAAAAMTAAFAAATIPKVNVIVGKAFGSAAAMMNSKALGADLVYAWEDAKIGMMDATAAAKIMYSDGDGDLIAQKAKDYDALQNSIDSAAGRGYVDTIVEARETRKYVIAAFELLFTKRESKPDKKHESI